MEPAALHDAERDRVDLSDDGVARLADSPPYTYALRHLPVSFVSLYAYINPLIAVTLGVLLLAEPFNARMGIAAALILFGVAIVKARREAIAETTAYAACRAARRRLVAPDQEGVVKWIDGVSSTARIDAVDEYVAVRRCCDRL